MKAEQPRLLRDCEIERNCWNRDDSD